jgi:hypothetical protein
MIKAPSSSLGCLAYSQITTSLVASAHTAHSPPLPQSTLLAQTLMGMGGRVIHWQLSSRTGMRSSDRISSMAMNIPTLSSSM